MHDPDTKARVVSALLTGLAIAEVVRQYGVPKPTVIRWRDEALVAVDSDHTSKTSGPHADLSWLPVRGQDWQENFQRHLDDSLYSMRVQVAYLSRPDVLERTDYAAIVDAYGTLADRIARIAEAIGRVEGIHLDDRSAGPGPSGALDPAGAAV